MSHIHIIGAGMAGLGAAVECAKAGRTVTLYEAAPQAGGRCRSFYDKLLGCEIDNGNHLLLSGNYSAQNYLSIIGAQDPLIGPERAIFPFIDMRNGARWDMKFNNSALPLWLLKKSSRVPEASLKDHLALAALLNADEHTVIGDFVAADNPLYEKLIEPLSIAIINMPPDSASAALMRNVLKETILKGGRHCQPRIARNSLAQSFVDPALEYLKRHNCEIIFGARLKAISYVDNHIGQLHFTNHNVEIGAQDNVIMALPPEPSHDILNFLKVPQQYSSIVNAHFRLPAPITIDWPAPFIGMIGSVSQWLFVRDDMASITISAGDAYLNMDANALAQQLWTEIAPLLGYANQPMPPARIIKEKRATIAQTPEQERLRPRAQTPFKNLTLAGDWTDTKLPATIEGAIRSGHDAAHHILNK